MLSKGDNNCSTFLCVCELWEYHRKWRNSKFIRCMGKGLQVCCIEPARLVRHHFRTDKTSLLYFCRFSTVLCRIGFSPFITGVIRWNLNLLSSGILIASSDHLVGHVPAKEENKSNPETWRPVWVHWITTPAALAVFDARICWHRCPIFAYPGKLRNILNWLQWPSFYIR